MADDAVVTIFPNINGEYVTPNMCCVCGSKEVSKSVTLNASHRNTIGSAELPACSEHGGFLGGGNMRMSLEKGGYTFSYLNSNFAHALLFLNLKSLVKVAKNNSDYVDIMTLVSYYVSNREELPQTVLMFNELEIGEIISQGLKNGLLEKHTAYAEPALSIELTLVELNDISEGIEWANRFLHKAAQFKMENRAQQFIEQQSILLPDYKQEVATFLYHVLGNKDLPHNFQIATIIPLASLNPNLLIEAAGDNTVNVKVRSAVVDMLRKESWRIQDPNILEKFQQELQTNKQLQESLDEIASHKSTQRKNIYVLGGCFLSLVGCMLILMLLSYLSVI